MEGVHALKNHSLIAKGLTSAFFVDCRRNFSLPDREWERDEHRLLSQIETRGLRVVTLELPALGKHFDMCLSRGQYVPSGLPHGMLKRRHAIPRLFYGLMSLVFDHISGLVRDDCDITAIAFLRQAFYMFKKVRLDCGPAATFAAITEFYHNEEKLPTGSYWWNEDEVPPCRHTRSVSFADVGDITLYEPQREFISSEAVGDDERQRHLVTLQAVADRVLASFGEFLPFDVHTKHGPGAVSEPFRDSKYEFPSWTVRLDRVFPYREFAFTNYFCGLYPASFRQTTPIAFKREGESKLIVVPKTQKGPRLIASESICNQFTQQGIMDYITQRSVKSLLGNAVTFRDQEPSRVLALEASRTGELITVDLSSASDFMSCWVVERLVRANYSLLRALHATRSTELVNGIDKKQPTRLRLRKFAPMGAATTFPLQSILYATMAITAIIVSRGQKVSTKSIRAASRLIQVFGDDIIAPKFSERALFSILEGLWFKISQAKTFTEGFFRESCGMDAYKGHDVTPAYFLEPFLETRPSSLSSVVEASNNLFLNGYWACSDYLRMTIPNRWLNMLPTRGVGEGYLGLSSFCGRDTDHLKQRWNHDLQQTEYRSASLRVKAAPTTPLGEHALHQYFVDAPGPDVVWTPGVVRDSRQIVTAVWSLLS
jgi:hypothetical protein